MFKLLVHGVKIEAFVVLGFRLDGGTACSEGEPELECCSYGMSHGLRGLLSFCEGFSSNCKNMQTRDLCFETVVSEEAISI